MRIDQAIHAGAMKVGQIIECVETAFQHCVPLALVGPACRGINPTDMPASPTLVLTWQAPALPGLVLGPEIGRGRVGMVYRATTEDGTAVAVKIVPDTGVSAERFLREARILGGLKHPRIIRCQRAGKAEGCLYLVMDLAVNDLRHRLAAGALPEASALRLMDQVAEGLEALAAHGIVHRDLSPGNLLFNLAGDALLGDFGLAAASDPALTRTGEILGTIAYLSPEQARGEPADARSDVYGLGAVILHAVSGRPPVSGDNAWTLLRTIAAGPDHEPHQSAPELSLQLRAILRCCLAAAPDERYPSASALREDLAAVARGDGPKRAAALRRRPLAPPAVAAPSRLLPRTIAIAAGLVAGIAFGLLGAQLTSRREPGPSATFAQALSDNTPEAWRAFAEQAPAGDEAVAARSMLALWQRLPESSSATVDNLRSELQATRRHLASLPPPASAAALPSPGNATHAPAAANDTAPAPVPDAPVPGTTVPDPAAADPVIPDATIATVPQAPPSDPLPLPTFEITDRVPTQPGNSCLAHPTSAGRLIAWALQGINWTSDGGVTWTASTLPQGIMLADQPGAWRVEGDEVFIPARAGAFGILSQDGGRTFGAIPMPVALPLPGGDHDSRPHMRLADGRMVCVISHAQQPRESIYVQAPGASGWTLVHEDNVALTGLFPLRSGLLALRLGLANGSWDAQDGGTRRLGVILTDTFPRWESADCLTFITVQGHGTNDREIVELPLPTGAPRIRRLPSAAWKPAEFQCFAIDPREPRYWYAVNSSTGLWLSRDSGATFKDFICITASTGAGRNALAFTAGPNPALVIADSFKLKIVRRQP